MSERMVLHVTLESRKGLRSLTVLFAYMLLSSIIPCGIDHLWVHTKEHINAQSETLDPKNVNLGSTDSTTFG